MNFTAALDSYRSIIDAADENAEQRFRIVDRWRAHSAAQAAWDIIEQAATAHRTQPPPPEIFIDWLVEQSVLFGRLASEVIPRAPGSIQKAERLALKNFNGSNPAYGAAQKLIAGQFRDKMTVVLGRQPNPQKRFIQMCSEMFITQCGKPLDGVVAMLASVVFGGDVSIDVVRGSQRPTRRSDRDTGGKKI